MNRHVLYLIVCMIAFAAIVAAQDDGKPANGEEDVNKPSVNAKAFAGTYVGSFGKRKITICIDRVIGETVTGYSIVAGNERAFSGSLNAVDGDLVVVAKEPGDHPADGVFRFTWFGKTKTLLGEWEANDKKIGITKFNLPSRKFSYNPKAGQYPQSSSRVLKEQDVENLKKEELRIMRNEIYARRGYSFKLADMREHFDKLDWYMPVAIDITDNLTKTEKANEALIKRYENYSAEFYDEFGR